jgi:hypothetical protein
LHGSTALFGDEDLETRAAEIYDSGNDDSVEKAWIMMTFILTTIV